MAKDEYDDLINGEYICRIAFKDEYPYIAPFLYVFDGEYIYFLSTKYGKKIKLFTENPKVAVEIEKYNINLTDYKFVTLQGRIMEVTEVEQKNEIKSLFISMLREKDLSPKILAALGHSPDEPLESLLKEDKSYVWKLTDVENIIGLKNS